MNDDRTPEFVLPPEPDSGHGEDEPRPRRVSIRKINREMKEKERKRRERLQFLEHFLDWGIPIESIKLYGRWWQFERWIRDLVQLELQSRYGAEWTQRIASVEQRRLKHSRGLTYMPSSDDSNPLGFADLGDLQDLIASDWSLFQYALPPKIRWEGTLNTLAAVRHRIAHCRNPHVDDLGRVEQALRDLESGARACLKSYSSNEWVTPESDPQMSSLLEGGTNYGRVEHAYNSYKTTFRIHKSRRPWSKGEKPGVLYHADFHSRDNPPDVERVWEYVKGTEHLEFLVHLNFYAINSVEAVVTPSGDSRSADLIDNILEAVLSSESRRQSDWDDWPRYIRPPDYHVHVDDLFAKASDMSQGGSIFFWPERP